MGDPKSLDSCLCVCEIDLLTSHGTPTSFTVYSLWILTVELLSRDWQVLNKARHCTWIRLLILIDSLPTFQSRKGDSLSRTCQQSHVVAMGIPVNQWAPVKTNPRGFWWGKPLCDVILKRKRVRTGVRWSNYVRACVESCWSALPQNFADYSAYSCLQTKKIIL